MPRGRTAGGTGRGAGRRGPRGGAARRRSARHSTRRAARALRWWPPDAPRRRPAPGRCGGVHQRDKRARGRRGPTCASAASSRASIPGAASARSSASSPWGSAMAQIMLEVLQPPMAAAPRPGRHGWRARRGLAPPFATCGALKEGMDRTEALAGAEGAIEAAPAARPSPPPAAARAPSPRQRSVLRERRGRGRPRGALAAGAHAPPRRAAQAVRRAGRRRQPRRSATARGRGTGWRRTAAAASRA
jgi:hypothetical protein